MRASYHGSICREIGWVDSLQRISSHRRRMRARDLWQTCNRPLCSTSTLMDREKASIRSLAWTSMWHTSGQFSMKRSILPAGLSQSPQTGQSVSNLPSFPFYTSMLPSQNRISGSKCMRIQAAQHPSQHQPRFPNPAVLPSSSGPG